MSDKPLNYAMIGGGTGSFIGAVHRKAAALDAQARLVAGAFSSSPERSLASAREIGVPEDRAYASYEDLIERERARKGDDRVDFVSIVTPNDTHFPIAKACLEAGFDVVLDKPATHTSVQADELAAIAAERGLVCCVTYNYSGNAMIRQASEMVATGTLGAIRKVFCEYHQGWLATPLEATGMKQAAWRTDPARAGLGGALGDIGTHAENLMTFVTGLEIGALCADLTSFVPGRQLDDDAAVLVRFKERDGVHAKGVLTCSQVCPGAGNDLVLRVYGDAGGLVWRQQTPETLEFTPVVEGGEGQTQVITRGGHGVSKRAAAASRIPAGHPEGYLEAFANIYLGAIELMRADREGREPGILGKDTPTIVEGARGVRFVEKCVESSHGGVSWVEC